MKVKDLIKKLQEADPELLVFCISNSGEYQYGVVNTAGVMGLRLEMEVYEHEDDETDVFVIDEE